MSDPYLQSPLRTADKVRSLPVLGDGAPVRAEFQPGLVSAPSVDDDDPIYREVLRLLADGFAGVIFVGPPGTSKSWYAAAIADRLADGDAARRRSIQFHPGYQYDDFVEGYVPDPSVGFRPVSKQLLLMCEAVPAGSGLRHVLVIDELSRSDPARVFGEALTYIETTKRDIKFSLPSGREVSIPPELVVLATMNSFDRGVEDVDAAFERRFAQIRMGPDESILARFLDTNGMDPNLKERVVTFFRWLQRSRNRHSHIGHTYFLRVQDEETLRRLWTYQLRALFERAFRLDDRGLTEVVNAWQRIFAAPVGPEPEAEQGAVSVNEATPDVNEGV